MREMCTDRTENCEAAARSRHDSKEPRAYRDNAQFLAVLTCLPAARNNVELTISINQFNTQISMKEPRTDAAENKAAARTRHDTVTTRNFSPPLRACHLRAQQRHSRKSTKQFNKQISMKNHAPTRRKIKSLQEHGTTAERRARNSSPCLRASKLPACATNVTLTETKTNLTSKS